MIGPGPPGQTGQGWTMERWGRPARLQTTMSPEAAAGRALLPPRWQQGGVRRGGLRHLPGAGGPRGKERNGAGHSVLGLGRGAQQSHGRPDLLPLAVGQPAGRHDRALNCQPLAGSQRHRTVAPRVVSGSSESAGGWQGDRCSSVQAARSQANSVAIQPMPSHRRWFS